jgi:hypothetical protein
LRRFAKTPPSTTPSPMMRMKSPPARTIGNAWTHEGRALKNDLGIQRPMAFSSPGLSIVHPSRVQPEKRRQTPRGGNVEATCPLKDRRL